MCKTMHILREESLRFYEQLNNVFSDSRGETKTYPLHPMQHYISPHIYCEKLFFFPL